MPPSLQRGYYEDLIGVNRFNSELWEVYTQRPSDWPRIEETPAAQTTGDNYILELVPSSNIVFHGAEFSTNRWGMRDQDYELAPSPNTYRIALLGPSFVMGSGVADDKVFESLLEERLNGDNNDSRYAHYEILNFGVAGYSALQELLVLENKALSFEPNAVFFVAHQREQDLVVRYMADRVRARVDLPYDDLAEVVQRAGISEEATPVEIERRLRPFGREMLLWTYRRVVELSKNQGALPIWVFMPTLETSSSEEDIANLIQIAEEAGFIVVNLSDTYENQDVETLIVAEWDRHPNVKGHQLIADHLYEVLQEKEEEIPLGLSTQIQDQ